MIPNWLNKKTPQQLGRDAEKRLAKKVGGKVQPGSGAFPQYKEDVQNDSYLIQLKRTEKKQYTLKLKDLEAVRINAIKVGKIPAFVIEMGGRTYTILIDWIPQ